MQAVKQKQSPTIFIKKIRIETIEAISCFEVRKTLDALFDRKSMLEEMPAGIKRKLFSHLETCRDCCRAFDVRVCFRSTGRATIY